MAKTRYVWHPEESSGPEEPSKAQEAMFIGQGATRWLAALQDQYPELLAHLVWDRERLDQLNRAVTSVLRDDPLVTSAV